MMSPCGFRITRMARGRILRREAAVSLVFSGREGKFAVLLGYLVPRLIGEAKPLAQRV